MNNFEKWLLQFVSQSSTYKYSHAINSISEDMTINGVIEKNLYNYSNKIELNFVIDKILSNTDFTNKNKTGHSMYSTALKYFCKYVNENTCTSEIKLTQDDFSFSEGEEKLQKHIIRERNYELIRKAKEKFKSSHNNKLFCEICGFDFTDKYGELGNGFIEAHHIKPVSQMKPGEKTSLDDIIMVCSNCHSMIHRKKPWLDRNLIKQIIV